MPPMSNPRQPVEPPASRPLLHIFLFVVSIALFTASMTQVAFTVPGTAAAPPVTTSAPVIATTTAAPATTELATTQIAATNTQPATTPAAASPPVEPVQGYTTLLYGWTTLKDFKIAWLANVVYVFIVLFTLTRMFRKLTAGASLWAMAIAACFLLMEDVTINGELKKIASYGPGFYLWIGSMVIMWLGFALNPAWKEATRLKPAPVQKKSTAIVKAKKQPEPESDTQIATSTDWPFFYGRKPNDD